MKYSGAFTLLSLAVAAIAAPTADPSQVVAQLRASNLSPQTQIFLATDPNFANETTQRWTTFDSPKYVISVKPAVEQDVQTVVHIANNNSLPFLATGGGHGFSINFGKIQNGIEIDLGFFKSIKVDSAANTATIGGSVLIKEIIPALADAGKEMPTGSQGCVGIVGATLGGGIGRLIGLHGMISDSLLSVRMVTASGDIVEVSASKNSDLYWGMKGAGFNYGVIVSATYRIYDATNGGNIMNADFLFPANASTAVFNYFKSLQDTLPAELSLIFQAGYNAKLGLGGPYIVVNAAYTGPQSKGLPLIQGLLNAGPALHNVSMTTYKDQLYDSFFASTPRDAPCAKGSKIQVYGQGIKSYDIPTFQNYYTSLLNLWSTKPETQDGVWFIEAFPTQAVRAIPDDSSAYPHRDITTHLLFDYQYTTPSLESYITSFHNQVRKNFAATSGFTENKGLEVYVSYGHGDEGPDVLYATRKLPKLRALKQKWDPKGAFRFNEPLN